MRTPIGTAATSSLTNPNEVDEEEEAETLPGLVSGGAKGWVWGGLFSSEDGLGEQGPFGSRHLYLPQRF